MTRGMILFSDLFKLLLYHNNFVKFSICGLTSNYEQVEFSNKGLSDLHNTILYTECLLGGSFKIINMDIEYDFLSFKDSNEKSIIHAKCLIEVVNFKNRIHVKKFILIVDDTVNKYISDITRYFLEKNEIANLKIIQLDKIERSINSQNKTKPIKIKDIRLLKLFARPVTIEKENCFNYIFDNFIDYILEFEILIFGKLKIHRYHTRTNIIDVEKNIDDLYKNINEINSILDKKLFVYIKNLTDSGDVSISLAKNDDCEFLNKDPYLDFNTVFMNIKNSDFESEKFEYFRNLLYNISKNNKTLEIDKLIFNFKNEGITLEIEMNCFCLLIVFKCENTRFLNLIYSKELEEKLEKLSIIGDC